MVGGVGDLLDCPVESRFVGLGGLGAATDLAHVLQRGGLDLSRGGVGFEIMEGPDVSAHTSMLNAIAAGIEGTGNGAQRDSSGLNIALGNWFHVVCVVECCGIGAHRESPELIQPDQHDAAND